MAQEIEARWIKLDQKEIEEKLRILGAIRESDSLFKEWVFGYPEWPERNQRIRIRDDGSNVWLTYKENPFDSIDTVDSTEEIEISVSSSSDTAKILDKIGIPMVRHQEKKRIEYRLGDAAIDLDFWPSIPMVVEIEASNKERVMEVANLLGIPWKDALFVNQKVLHKQHFGIDLDAMKEYKF